MKWCGEANKPNRSSHMPFVRLMRDSPSRFQVLMDIIVYVKSEIGLCRFPGAPASFVILHAGLHAWFAEGFICGGQILKQDPSDEDSRKTLTKMMPEVERRREKMKDEMIGAPPTPPMVRISIQRRGKNKLTVMSVTYDIKSAAQSQ